MKTDIIIPNYTADDFRSSSEPYAFVQGYADDPFLQRQLLAKLKLIASKCGVREFMSLWKDYQSSLKRQSTAIVDNATDFPDQPLELQCGHYSCDVSGVRIRDIFGGETVVCAHPIMPIRRLVNVDDGTERLELAYRKGVAWRTLIAEKAVLASSSSILQLAANGVFVNSENAKALSTFLFDIEQQNYAQIPEVKSVSRLGWVGDHGFSPYVDDVFFDGENNFKAIFNAVRSCGDREKWVDAMRAVRAEHGFGRLFLAASFASVILEPCGLLPFFVHAWGGTEVGKTVGLMIAASVWASPRIGDYIGTFNSTTVGQEMLAGFLNSLPMCIDELQIQSSGGIKDFDKIIYQLTEGVGRTRGAKTGGLQRVLTWKNCFITNGESPISNANSGGGAVNRIIEFECTEKVYSDLVGLCAVINSNFGFAGREFVEFLQSEGACERVNALQKDFYRELLKSDSTDKQAASASALLAADSIATDLIFKDGNALTVADLAAIMTKKSDVDINARALDYIYELVERNPIHFNPSEYGVYKAEIWGKLKYGDIYIIKSVFDREMSLAGFNAASFLAWAKRQGILSCDEGRRTKKAQIANSTVNTVCLHRTQDDIDTLNVYTDDDDLPM